MAEWDTKLNRTIENGKKTEKSGNRIALQQQIQQELSSATWSAPNPSQVPLNYIENMDKWEQAQKDYNKEITAKQRELAIILQLTDDKEAELDLVRAEKTKLDIELQKIIWSLMNKLMPYEGFLHEMKLKIENWLQKLENYEKNIKNMEWIDEEALKNKKLEVTIKFEKEPTPEEIEDFKNQALAQLKQQWIGPEKVIFKYVVWEDNRENEENFNVENWDYNWENDWGENMEWMDDESSIVIPNYLAWFLQLADPEVWDVFNSLLDDKESQKLSDLRKSVQELIDKYEELWQQSFGLWMMVEKLEWQLASVESAYIEGEEAITLLNENMEKMNQVFFLDSYQSTKKVSLDDFVASPIVEKQIKYLLELNKKWLPIPKTILLYGWHNLWKTFAANLLASELGRKMYHIKSYDIYTWWYSDPNEMLDAIFTWAIKQKEPCIIFLDEMENFNIEGWGWPYQKLVENTIRHHISKLKESNLDVIVIWAVADKSKIDWNLLKQEVFSKQILFSPLWKDKAEELIRKILSKKWVKLADDCNLDCFFKNDKKDGKYTHDYIKWFVDILLSLHEWEKDIILKDIDFEQAMKIIMDTEHAMWSAIGYVN